MMKIKVSILIHFFILNNLVNAESKVQIDLKGLQGEYRIEHSNGNPAVVGKFKDGKRKGKWKAFHANGKLFYSRNFKNGLEEGLSTYYDSNGQKIIEGNYKRGWKVGAWKFYYPDGSIKAEGVCERNTFHKEWIFYSKSDTITYTYSLGRTTFENENWYNDTMDRMLVKSYTSASLVVNGHKRFMWLLNSIDDYQLEYDLNEKGLPHGMYSFSHFQSPNILDLFHGEMSNASFVNGIKHGIQKSYFYKVSSYTKKERKAKNAKYRKQKRKPSYNGEFIRIHQKVENKRKDLTQWKRPFKYTFSFGFVDVAIISGINDMGNFKGKFYSEKTGHKPTYIDERKDSIKLIDNFYQPQEVKKKYLLFDSLCKVNKGRNNIYKDTVLTEWDNSIFSNDFRVNRRTVFYKFDSTIIVVQFIRDENIIEFSKVLNPAHFFPIASYPQNAIGYTFYSDDYNPLETYNYPYNTLLHGSVTYKNFGSVTTIKNYNYGFLTEYKLIN